MPTTPAAFPDVSFMRHPAGAIGHGTPRRERSGRRSGGMIAALVIVSGAVAAAGAATAQARQTAQVQGGAYCSTLTADISRMASSGFQVLNARRFCAAVELLENAYRSFDSGRANCGRRWARSQAMLEMDLLDALDYAGEYCGPR